MKMNKQIDTRLQKLGITKKYNGYFLLKSAVELALEDDFRLQSVMKEIYKPVAEMHSCNFCCVERNIRTVLFTAWNSCSNELIRMARFQLPQPPSVSEFISIIASDIQRSDEESDMFETNNRV